ncbi:hypothetical protein [Marinimicrobium alkaliphilum]|uniref:hypothetical protein n=1 Tax=Marinimicrobium alkaliphilum TaxID=2202654 RepID=UPI000DBACE68|nr:hypothetical protein [Marinimicrobium alkaliphilum]
MERKEPTFSGIKPEPDEISERQKRAVPGADAKPGGDGRPERNKGSGGGDKRRPPPPPRPPSGSAPGGGVPIVAVLALLVALAGVSASAYLGLQLVETQDDLALANQRIRDLRERLDLTSDESSETVDEIRDKLQWADSEIRKLWGVSHDRNRRAIAENKEQLEQLGRDLSAARSQTSSVDEKLGRLESQVNESRTALDERLSEVNERIGQVVDQTGRLQAISDRLTRTENQVRSLREQSAKVEANVEAIEAIDNFRRTVNRDLLEIRQQLGMPAN